MSFAHFNLLFTDLLCKAFLIYWKCNQILYFLLLDEIMKQLNTVWEKRKLAEFFFKINSSES